MPSIKNHIKLYTAIILLLIGISAPALIKKIQINQTASHSYFITDISKTYRIDAYYPSMQGPFDYHKIKLSNAKNPELLWLRGIKQEIIDKKGQELSSENFCHGHLLLNYEETQWETRKRMMGNATLINKRLFTLMQGQEEIHFPEGFAIPVSSHEPFQVGSMLLNYDKNIEPMELKVKTTIIMNKDRELVKPLTPLFLKQISLLNGSKKNSHHEDPHPGHWYVPPGRHEYRYQLPEGLNLQYDTTAHFIATHLHPYGESLELIDLTQKKSVFKSFATNNKYKPAITHLDYYSDEKGISVHKDHKYELVAQINNTSNNEVDMMASMYLFVADKAFNIQQLNLP